MSIKKKVPVKKWDSKLGLARENSIEVREVNNYINSIRHKINAIHEKLLTNEEHISAKKIAAIFKNKTSKKKMILEEFLRHNEYVNGLVGKEYSESTKKRYYTAYKHLKQFMQSMIEIL